MARFSKTGLIQKLLMLLACLFMLAGAAVVRYGAFGPLAPHGAAESADAVTYAGTTMIVDTKDLCRDVTGYAGPTPLRVYVTDGRVDSVVAQANSESPGFFQRVRQSLLGSWDGLTLQEAITTIPDGVTGATYSSESVKANAAAAFALALSRPASAAGNSGFELSAGFVASLIVVLCGCLLPLFIKSRRYRVVQLIVNVVVLGFWTGTFLDYIVMIGVVGRGVAGWSSAVVVLMLVAAFIYPLFGRRNHYCLWICPLGSAQELLGKTGLPKLKLSARAESVLDWFRIILWSCLMLAMWVGGWLAWIDYELFAAFMLDSAVTGLLVAALVVAVLSLFVSRPYCRFVCPTGTLFRIPEIKE